MKRIVYPLAVLALTASLGAAHAESPKNTEPMNPAIHTNNKNKVDTPVSGANSFTESQARERITEKGFADVSALVKDDKGIWHGKAAKGGVTHDVSVDYQGNVTHK